MKLLWNKHEKVQLRHVHVIACSSLTLNYRERRYKNSPDLPFRTTKLFFLTCLLSISFFKVSTFWSTCKMRSSIHAMSNSSFISPLFLKSKKLYFLYKFKKKSFLPKKSNYCVKSEQWADRLISNLAVYFSLGEMGCRLSEKERTYCVWVVKLPLRSDDHGSGCFFSTLLTRITLFMTSPERDSPLNHPMTNWYFYCIESETACLTRVCSIVVKIYIFYRLKRRLFISLLPFFRLNVWMSDMR